MISLDNLTVSYGGWTLFDNISLLINPKDRIGLVGKNGAGKTTALVNSGLPGERFCFEGFLPQKKGRQKKLESLSKETRTIVLYESPHRLIKCLEQIIEFWGDRQLCVSRELSKMFEENFRGTASQAVAHFTQKQIKGEIVIVVAGAEEEETQKHKNKYRNDDDDDEDDEEDDE